MVETTAYHPKPRNSGFVNILHPSRVFAQKQLATLITFLSTGRDYRTGMVFMGFTNYKDTISTSIFAEYLIEYLKGLGTDLNDVAFQTDNGTEFIDPLYNSTTIFEQTLAKHGIQHLRIPPKAPTFDSDVESFHNTIEKEFLDIEQFPSLFGFFVKSFIYLTYYNHIRKIRTRDNKSPVETYTNINSNSNKLKLCYIPILRLFRQLCVKINMLTASKQQKVGNAGRRV